MTRATVFRYSRVAIDLTVLSAALWLACLLRFEGAVPAQVLKRTVFLWPYIVGFQYTLLVFMGVPRFAWRYVSLREAVRIFLAVLTGSLVLTAARLIAAALMDVHLRAQYAYLPFGVIAIDSILAFLGLSGVRVFRRVTSERTEARRVPNHATRRIPTILVGAGRAGAMVAKEISARPELEALPIGFVDDDPLKLGTEIHGLRILGGVGDLTELAREYKVQQAIIAIANCPGNEVRRIAEECRRAGLKVKVIPGLYQLVSGQLNFTRLRDVAIEDLLRRDPVLLNDKDVAEFIQGAAVLLTGAGGSIGSEICRQVAHFKPRLLILLERSENALFEIHRELVAEHPDLELVPYLGDICDRARLSQVFEQYKPDLLFHAAAHKHVPMLESNGGEGVKNNIFGTRLLADMAHAHGLRSFVMISTDKAVNPTSVMGATKRVAELYVQTLAQRSKTRFVTVRFGNVLGSNGSVVPIFRQQIASGGPVTVTHPQMKRYFMTIPEACQLVLEAATMGKGGEIFILDMGEPVRIVDLARDLVRLSGFQADEIEIKFTGTRPGEKLFEELAVASENASKTRHPKIFIGKTRRTDAQLLHELLDRLKLAVDEGDNAGLRECLQAIVPEYTASQSPPSGSHPSESYHDLTRPKVSPKRESA